MRFLFAILLSMFFVSAAFAEENIGSFKKVSGDVSVNRMEEIIKAEAGMHLLEGDIIKSAADGSAGLIFKDGTIFSIGAETEVILTKYMFQPKDSKYSMRMNMKKGTAVYESGRMAKLAPEAVKILTPKATIGVRGTKFLVEVE